MDSSSQMEVDKQPLAPPSTQEKKRFELKKWNAVALWAWGINIFYLRPSVTCRRSSDIVVDNCAICRNHIMDLCKDSTAC